MKKILFSIILMLAVTVVSAQKTYILCGKLVDTKSGKIEKYHENPHISGISQVTSVSR